MYSNSTEQRNLNHRVITNDIAFHIQCKLQFSQGAELVCALGYPQLSTNKQALKSWVNDHYDTYEGLERTAIAEMMANDIHTQVCGYFGGFEINLYQ